MSDLEKFIRSNREDFDNAAPSNNAWENIDSSLSAKKPARVFSFRDVLKWSAAAAIFFIILTSIYFIFIRKDSHDAPVSGIDKPVKPTDAGSIAPEYAAEFQKVYESVISRQRELKTVSVAQPKLYQQFQDDIKALDSSYRLLKNQAAQSPNQDVIIKAMIQNLQLQAELLGRQLMIFNQFKNTKNSNNEGNS